MRALKSNVIVERIAGEKTTSFGFILKSSEGPDLAKITSIGSDVTEVEVGNVVLVDWNQATQIEDDIFILSIDDVVLVYE
jgi:co-chaperonin GroES (HSP10)